jgi:hypothetical protein
MRLASFFAITIPLSRIVPANEVARTTAVQEQPISRADLEYVITQITSLFAGISLVICRDRDAMAAIDQAIAANNDDYVEIMSVLAAIIAPRIGLDR